MSELYTIHVEGSRPRFELRQHAVQGATPEAELARGGQPGGHACVSRMGDPELLHCAVFRRSEGRGGMFALYDGNGLLFVAVAESNLAFALAQGVLGKMVADARYGADIFENMDEDDG